MRYNAQFADTTPQNIDLKLLLKKRNIMKNSINFIMNYRRLALNIKGPPRKNYLILKKE